MVFFLLPLLCKSHIIWLFLSRLMYFNFSIIFFRTLLNSPIYSQLYNIMKCTYVLVSRCVYNIHLDYTVWWFGLYNLYVSTYNILLCGICLAGCTSTRVAICMDYITLKTFLCVHSLIQKGSYSSLLKMFKNIFNTFLISRETY